MLDLHGWQFYMVQLNIVFNPYYPSLVKFILVAYLKKVICEQAEKNWF